MCLRLCCAIVFGPVMRQRSSAHLYCVMFGTRVSPSRAACRDRIALSTPIRYAHPPTIAKRSVRARTAFVIVPSAPAARHHRAQRMRQPSGLRGHRSRGVFLDSAYVSTVYSANASECSPRHAHPVGTECPSRFARTTSYAAVSRIAYANNDRVTRDLR